MHNEPEQARTALPPRWSSLVALIVLVVLGSLVSYRSQNTEVLAFSLVAVAAFAAHLRSVGLHDAKDSDCAGERGACAALAESEERFRLASSAMLDVAYSCRRGAEGEYAFDWIVGATETLLGYTRDEIAAVGCWKHLVFEADLPLFADNIACLEHGGSSECELRIRARSGQLVWVASYAHCYSPTGNDADTRIYGALLDITEKKHSEEQLRQLYESLEATVAERTEELQAANIQLQDASEAKSVFMRSMSHELRTPLNSIIGFSCLMLKESAGSVNDEQRRQLQMVNHSGRHLLELINDILDLSRIEAGHVGVNCESFEVTPFAHELLATITPVAQEKGLDLELLFFAEDVMLHSDQMKVRQILLNLLGNAVKFTDAGKVTLRVGRPAPGSVGFCVVDTGCGIPTEAYESIFGEFTRREPSTGDYQQGTGLGLSISRNLALLLGGTVTVESVVGEGSTFRLILPEEAPETT